MNAPAHIYDRTERTFSSDETFEISSVPKVKQRDWMRRGFFEKHRGRGPLGFTIEAVTQFALASELTRKGWSIGSVMDVAAKAAHPVVAQVLEFDDSIAFTGASLSDKTKRVLRAREIRRYGPEMTDLRFVAFFDDIESGKREWHRIDDLSALESVLAAHFAISCHLIDVRFLAKLIRLRVEGPFVEIEACEVPSEK